MNPRHRPGDGRREGDSTHPGCTLRKQVVDFRTRDSPNISVAWIVEHEIIPQDSSAGFDERPHLLGQTPLKSRIENRGENRRLEDYIEGFIRQLKADRVPTVQGDCCWQPLSCYLDSLVEQLIPNEILGRKPEGDELQQVCSGATTDFENLSLVHRGDRAFIHPCDEGPRALLIRHVGARQKRSIQRMTRCLVASRVALAYELDLGGFGLDHRCEPAAPTTSRNCLASTSYVWFART